MTVYHERNVTGVCCVRRKFLLLQRIQFVFLRFAEVAESRETV